MKRAQLISYLLLCLVASGCAHRHHASVPSASAIVAGDVSARIDHAATSEAKASVAGTPEARAAAKADAHAVARQEDAEARATLFRDAVYAIALVALAVAVAVEFPLLRSAMTAVAIGGGGFAVLALALRSLLAYVPWVAGGGAVVVAFYIWRHARIGNAALTDIANGIVAEDKVGNKVASISTKMRGKVRDAAHRLAAHIEHHQPAVQTPPARPAA